MDRFVVLSGCSGGGKSELLAELARRGHGVVAEPGRRIVAEERASGGAALPWVDGAAFARRAIAMALADREAARARPGLVFFDRGLVDACAALEHLTGEPALREVAARHRYGPTAFLVPPWRALFGTDDARRHGFADAVDEHGRLLRAYAGLDYRTRLLPRVCVEARADLVLAALGAPP